MISLCQTLGQMTAEQHLNVVSNHLIDFLLLHGIKYVILENLSTITKTVVRSLWMGHPSIYEYLSVRLVRSRLAKVFVLEWSIHPSINWWIVVWLVRPRQVKVFVPWASLGGQLFISLPLPCCINWYQSKFILGRWELSRMQ